MSNNLGLFQWIRDGVRQSVLLGVTDALDSIGSPDDQGKLHPALMSLNGNSSSGNPSITVEAETATNRRVGAAPRKRLGRSLKDIDPNKAAQ